jgi:hypothetical protein
MQQHTRPELADLTYANLPNNTAGAIDPAKLREVVLALIASQLNLLDDGNPGVGSGSTTPDQQQVATFGNLGGAAQDNVSLVSYLASLGHPLTEFTPPMSTQGGRWYLASTGIWEAKSSFNAAAAPAAGAYWRLVVSFGDALTATAAGKALLAAPTALAQRVLLDIFSVPAGAYGVGQPGFMNLYKEDGAVVYLLKKVDALSTQLAVINLAPSTTSPTVTGFLPASGAVGASITITGTLFTKASAVTFNGTPASFQVINATTIMAVVPVGATTGPVAVTNSAGTGTSAATFTVSGATTPTPTNQAPTVNLTGSSSNVNTGQGVTLTASPYDADGTIAKVDYFDNSAKIGETSSAPWAILTPGLSQGTHNFTAKTTDDKGATGTSTIFTVAVSTATTVYNGSYTARCGTDKAGTGPDVYRTAQGASQSEADAAARNAAIAALVCSVKPTYEWTLTGPSDSDSTGITHTTDGGAYLLQYNRIFNGDSTPKRMDIFSPITGEELAAEDFPASYLGQGFLLIVGNTTYGGIFTDGTPTLTIY